MFLITIIVYIILGVSMVRPTNAVNNLTLSQKPHTDGSNQVAVISDSFVQKKNNGSSPVGLQHLLLAEKSSNGTDGKHRGVTNTGVELAPSIADHINSSFKSSDESLKTSNVNYTNVNTTKKSNQTTVAAKTNPATSNTSLLLPNIANSTISTTKTTTMTTPNITSTTLKSTTTTQIPKKPLITFAVDDVPELLSIAESQSPLPIKDIQIADAVGNNEPLFLQSSETITYSDQRSNHNFLVVIFGIIVVIPVVVVITNCAVRKVKDVWSKRRYRRMDYLIEDMYN